MAILISANTEILVLGLFGLVVTAIEGSYLNLNETLHEVWRTSFPEGLYSITVENLLKSAISGIILVRGITVHINLASYLLMIYPVLKERKRVMLIIWLFVSGLRNIIVHLLATLTGAVICASCPEPHPACFRFITIKGFEIALMMVSNRQKHRHTYSSYKKWKYGCFLYSPDPCWWNKPTLCKAPPQSAFGTPDEPGGKTAEVGRPPTYEACSVYFWVIVNDFYYNLKRRTNRSEGSRTEMKMVTKHPKKKSSRQDKNGIKLQGGDSVEKMYEDSQFSLASVEDSLFSLSTSIIERINLATNTEDDLDSVYESEDSFDSVIAKAAVNWFLRQTLGMKYHGWNADRDAQVAQKFLSLTSEDMGNVVERLKEAISKEKQKKVSDEGEICRKGLNRGSKKPLGTGGGKGTVTFETFRDITDQYFMHDEGMTQYQDVDEKINTNYQPSTSTEIRNFHGTDKESQRKMTAEAIKNENVMTMDHQAQTEELTAKIKKKIEKQEKQYEKNNGNATE